MSETSCGRCIHKPIWPSNTGNEVLHYHQNLFNRDTHNHSEVLHEQIYGLPYDVPANRSLIGSSKTGSQNEQGAFRFVNASTGQVQTAPFSTENAMHTDWVPYRLGVNLNTHVGSDSDIYFQGTINPAVQQNSPIGGFYEGTPAQVGYNAWMDWLDNHTATGPSDGISGDEAVQRGCSKPEDLICEQTCVDWWTRRPVPPQGSLQRLGQPTSGGCPFNTVQALACYPCGVNATYIKGAAYPKSTL